MKTQRKKIVILIVFLMILMTFGPFKIGKNDKIEKITCQTGFSTLGLEQIGMAPEDRVKVESFQKVSLRKNLLLPPVLAGKVKQKVLI